MDVLVKRCSLVALFCILFSGFGAGEAQAQVAPLTLVDGARSSYGLGTVWVWQNEDGSFSTRGVIPKLKEQERVILSVQGSKKKKGKKPKLTGIGSVSGEKELNGSLDANLPLHLRLNYKKGDRVQTAPLARAFKVEDPLEPGQAVVVTFRLVGVERVEGERQLMECEHLLSLLGLGQGNGCIVAE